MSVPPDVRPPIALTQAIGLACTLFAACEDLSEFRTDDDHVFGGEVIGSGDESTSFIRRGFASRTQLELTFDPGQASDVAASDPGTGEASVSPGTIHTYTCPADPTPCAGDDRKPGPLDHAALEPIESLSHDALSRYDFPGGGRLKNYMFGARFESELGADTVQRHAMVFLSLMENGRVEARIIAPSVRESGTKEEAHPALFGVFMLDRRER
jgi:hypothetical protein